MINGTVWPPEPDTPAGFAMILTKGSCPDKEVESERTVEFFAIGERGMRGRYVIRELERIVTYPLTPENSEKLTPKWLPQVMDTIKHEAPVNPAAQAFLDELQRRHAAGSVAGVLPKEPAAPDQRPAPVEPSAPAPTTEPAAPTAQ